MRNLHPLKFSGGTKNKVRTSIFKGDWYPDISVALVTDVGVPVKGIVSYI